MKSAFNPFLSVACTLFTLTVSHAADFNYGALTMMPVTLTATDQAREVGNTPGVFNDNGLGSIYDRGSLRDKLYIHFDLSPLAGRAISGDFSLNLLIDAQYGGEINNGLVGTANAPWTYTSGGAVPGYTSIASSPLVNGNFSSGQTASWTITNATFSDFLANPANFHGLVLDAAAGSRAHFAAAATLTGLAEGYPVRVLNATDWSAAVFDQPSLTLTVGGTSDVIGGNVFLSTGTTLSVTDAATLDSGNFAGTFSNDGTISFSSSANQTLSGAINGTGVLQMSGSGTLTLNGSINYKGGTVVTGGTLELPGGDWVTGNPWGTAGATGPITIGNGATLSTSAGVTQLRSGLTLSGGTLSSRGLGYDGQWGNIFLSSDITANGNASSLVSSQILLNNTRSVLVEAGSTLSLTGRVTSWNQPGAGINKAGGGTLTLSGANSYDGQTNITAGTVLATSNTALGVGGHNGTTMSFIRDGATLALQGNISLDEHFHVWGSGVGGQGALRSISGNNALTNSPGGGPGYCLRSNTTVAVDDGTLTVAGFYQDAGSFGLTKIGAGSLVLSAPGGFSGTTTISAGSIRLGHPAALQSSAFDIDSSTGGVLDVTGQTSFSLGGLFGLRDLDASSVQGYESISNLTLNLPGGTSQSYAGSITQGAAGMSLTKSGDGTQVLSGNNSYSGLTGVSGGSLVFEAGSSSLGNLAVSGGNLTFRGSSVVTGGNLHFSGFPPTLVIAENADVTLTGGISHQPSTITPFDPYHAANYVFSGGVLRTTSIAGASISWRQADTSMHFDGTRVVALDNNPSFISTTGWDDGNLINLGSTNGMILDSNGFSIGINESLVNDPANSGAGGKLTKLGAGSLTLGGQNSYTGDTLVDDGTLVLADNARLSFVVTDSSSNRISGAGSVDLKGDFAINTSAANPASYVPQTLVSANASYDATFTVIGFTQQPDGVTWTRREGSWLWSFSETTGQLTVAQGSDYDVWAQANGVNGEAGDDDDGDGLTNFQEYAFGLNPGNPGSVNPIAVPFNPTAGTFSYTRRAGSSIGVTYAIEYSTDLGTWSVDSGAAEGTPVLNGEVETVPVSISPGLLSNPRIFIRVQAASAN